MNHNRYVSLMVSGIDTIINIRRAERQPYKWTRYANVTMSSHIRITQLIYSKDYHIQCDNSLFQIEASYNKKV